MKKLILMFALMLNVEGHGMRIAIFDYTRLGIDVGSIPVERIRERGILIESLNDGPDDDTNLKLAAAAYYCNYWWWYSFLPVNTPLEEILEEMRNTTPLQAALGTVIETLPPYLRHRFNIYTVAGGR